MEQNIKSKIDSIWETFWTGGLTNPLSVIEQITYLLFIKLLDDNQIKQEKKSNLLGLELKNATFKKGTYVNSDEKVDISFDDLRWSNFKNFEADKLFRNIRDNVFPFIKNLNNVNDSSFSRYMKNAIFQIPTPRVLVKVIYGLDTLEINNKDLMGDVYEYLLSKIATSGTNGQFRTPRHIIRMMVELMQPKLTDKICDPAMGSAGFISESAKYIKEKYGKELLNEVNMKNYSGSMFTGFDIDETMLRIGAMNMMLHGVDNPNIEYKNSLSEDNKDEEQYSLILANPPFTGTIDTTDISKRLLAITKTKKTELLFMALFTEILTVGGRCASIVPDGVLFGSSNAHLGIRKELIDNQKLEAIISMPSGVFKPYAGVSTAILIFTKTNAGGTDKVWFYDMKADGKSLDDKRNDIEANDIPDIINRFHDLNKESSRTKFDQSFFVTKDEIVSKDYDLSINKYKEVVKEKVEYESTKVILQRIEDYEKEFQKSLTRLKEMLGDE